MRFPFGSLLDAKMDFLRVLAINPDFLKVTTCALVWKNGGTSPAESCEVNASRLLRGVSTKKRLSLFYVPT